MARKQAFGVYLRACRLKASLGLRTFAEAAELKPSNLSAIEHGRQPPPQSHLVLSRIADALGLPKDSSDRRRLFDLAVKHKLGTLPPDVATFAGRTPGVPVLLRTIENRRLSKEELKRLTEYIDSHLGKGRR